MSHKVTPLNQMTNIESNESYLDDISYSICVDKTRIDSSENNPLKYTLPRKTHGWVDDSSVTHCFNCISQFGIFLRKHHCRLCGKIFCWKCTNYRDILPTDLLSDDSKKVTWNEYMNSYIKDIDLTKYRVCVTCHNLIEKVNSIKKITEVFKILDFDIKDLKKVGQVCKIWLNASNYYLSKFREIQYKLPSDIYTDWEKHMLRLNAKYCYGHNKYMIHLLKSSNYVELEEINYSEFKNMKNTSCWSMMCGRNCSTTLNSFDAINLLMDSLEKKNSCKLKKMAFKQLLNCSDIEFKCYIPLLTYNISKDSTDCNDCNDCNDKSCIISDFLIYRCINNHMLLNSFYWELLQYTKPEYINDIYNKTFTKLKQILSDEKYKRSFITLMQGFQLVNIINNISKDICDGKKYSEIKGFFNLKHNTIVPLNTNIVINKLCIENIKIKNSATKPIIIPCETVDGTIFNIMHKNESVRKDQIILIIIALLEMIVKNEEGIDLESVPYNILPISKNSGLVEIIDKCDTIYFVQEKLQSSILNYILEENDGIKITDLRSRFIKTTALYSVITYLLGVGDRHLDNIMITKDGRLFHIDFDYILGNDPVFNSSSIRITPEMIDAIGGFNSKYYTEFKDMCSKIFNCARRNINIFIHLINLIPKISDVKLTENDIREQIIKRFIPGENDIIAELHLVNKLEKQTYTDKIKDWCHYHSKEKTINNVVNLVSGVVTNSLSSVWNNNSVGSISL
jgi:hypothetical protein